MNIRGISDINPKKEKNNNRESYVGGEKSGLAVEDNVTKDLVNQARNQTGNNQPLPSNASRIIITLYSNGFIVSDDESNFRSYNDPQNKKFLEEMKSGNVPIEMREKHPNGLEVGLQDKRSQEYALPKPKKEFFKGGGVALDDNQSNVVKKEVKIGDLGDVNIKLNKDEKTHELCIKFPDGSRKIFKVNPSTKFGEVKLVLRNAIGNNNFKVCYAFPPKEIVGDEKSLLELDLLDSSVNVKPV